MQRPLETSWIMIKTEVERLVDQHVPRKIIDLSSPKSKVPWLNRDIKRKINRRNRAKRKAQRTGNQSDWDNYEVSRQEVSTSINAGTMSLTLKRRNPQ